MFVWRNIHLINPQLLLRWKARMDIRIQWQGADHSWSFSPSKSWGCKRIPAASALSLLLPRRKHWNTPMSLPLCLSIHFRTLNTQDCTLNTYNAHIMHTDNAFYLPPTHIDRKYPSLRYSVQQCFSHVNVVLADCRSKWPLNRLPLNSTQEFVIPKRWILTTVVIPSLFLLHN